MPETEDQSCENGESTKQYLKRVLNAHGYPFQFAVLQHARRLQSHGLSGWVFESSEVPVGESGRSTHIDFVLRRYDGRGSTSSLNLYLIAECKRVNPLKSKWCFVRNPYPMRNKSGSAHPIQFDRIVSQDSQDRYTKGGMIKHWDYPTFELPFELKTHKPNDPLSPLSKSPINDAAFQVLLGQRGFISHLTSMTGTDKHEQLRRENVFIPVVFTTADLFVSDVDLSDADLASGEVHTDSDVLIKRPWLWYNFRRHSDLDHPFEKYGSSQTNVDEYFAAFTRSVAFVSVSGIDEFLTLDFGQWLSG